jgi:hypothetical protein
VKERFLLINTGHHAYYAHLAAHDSFARIRPIRGIVSPFLLLAMVEGRFSSKEGSLTSQST